MLRVLSLDATAESPDCHTKYPLYCRPSRAAHFVGRRSELGRAHEQLAYRATHLSYGFTRCILHGLGGVGKTEIAIEYSNRNENRFSVIWWSRADDSEEIAKRFCDLGRYIGILGIGSRNDDSGIEKVRSWLESTGICPA